MIADIAQNTKFKAFVVTTVILGATGSVILIKFCEIINEATLVASLSISFYGSLCLTSMYFYISYTRRHIEKHGLYDDSKRFFLGVLTLSSLADLPLYIVCVSKGGPDECEWKELSYYVTWFLQLISLSGFCLILVIPSVLWTDVIKGYGMPHFFQFEVRF